MFAEGLVVAALGVTDLVIVATPERVLVAPKDRDQDLRDLTQLPTLREFQELSEGRGVPGARFL